jgi:hypothetical protein
VPIPVQGKLGYQEFGEPGSPWAYSVSLFEDVFVDVFVAQMRLREEEKKSFCVSLATVVEVDEGVFVSKGIKRRRARLKAKEKVKVLAERVTSSVLDKWKDCITSIYRVVLEDERSSKGGGKEFLLLSREDVPPVHFCRTNASIGVDEKRSLKAMEEELAGDR